MNSIIWPSVEPGCDITVYGSEVKALVKRYLEQMIEKLQTVPHPDGEPGTLVDAIDLIIPHQVSKRMVIYLAEQAGIGRDREVLQHRAGREHVRREHSPGDPRRRSRRRALDPDPRVHAWLRSGCGRRIRGAAHRPSRRRAGANRAVDGDGRRPVAGAAPHGVVDGRRGSLRRLTHGRDRSVFTPRRPTTPGDRQPDTAAAAEGTSTLARGGTRRPPPNQITLRSDLCICWS